MKKDLKILFPGSRLNSRKNHIIATCPYCGKPDHFFLNFTKAFNKIDGVHVACWDCKSCSEKGNLPSLLIQLKREDFLEEESIDLNKQLKNLITASEKEKEIEILEMPKKKLPIGFKRLYEDEYLESRGFTEEHFRLYKVGRTDLLFKFRDYIIFSTEENNICRGYQARSMLSKENIKEINKYRESKKKYLRWVNSKYTDFGKLVGGYDELNFLTEVVVGVEGLFDKVSVDNYLNLLFQQEMKCIYTFGKSISEEQIIKIKNKCSSIHTFILIQDPDAVGESKKSSSLLQRYFDNVFIGYTGNKDLGDSNDKEIEYVFNNLESPSSYRINKVLKRELL